MQSLNLPIFPYRIQPSRTGHKIFDVVRKKYVQLTPEEWVRQHFLHYLIGHLTYPKTLIRLERALPHPSLRFRPDLVVYNRLAQPLMLVECKAPNLPINNQEVWRQIGRYYAHCQARLLVMTNGIIHFCWQLDERRGNYDLLPTIPRFDGCV